MAIDNSKLNEVTDLVNKRYPDWSGFSDPRFVKDEVEYKKATVEKARELLSKEQLERLTKEGNFEEFVQRLDKIGKDNNLMWRQVPMKGDLNILYQEDLDKPSFCEAVFDLLYGSRSTQERFGRYLGYVEKNNLPNKWTFPMYFLFVCHPGEEIFLKHWTMRWFLEFMAVGEELTKKPSAESYETIRRVANDLKNSMTSFEPADIIDIQSLIWVAASEARGYGPKGEKDPRVKFSDYFEEFVNTYLATRDGQRHHSTYEEGRVSGRHNFEEVIAARERGEDITDLVLLKLLPYAGNESNRRAGAWVHIGPAVQGDLKGWFQKAGWTKEEDWPLVAEAILKFIQRCVDNPAELADACNEFSGLPYTKGLQTGFLTPILNALTPDDFLLINNKSRKTINYLTGESHGQKLTDYPKTNRAGLALVEELAEEIRRHDVPDIPEADLFDMFSHWLVAVKKPSPITVSYWKIAPGADASRWEECLEGNFIYMGCDEIGDVSGLNRKEFNKRRDALVAKSDRTKAGTDQVWMFSNIKEGDKIIANQGTSKVLGIGEVTGPYYFVPGVKGGHRLPVDWYDTKPRDINEPGWRRAIIKISREKFMKIVGGNGTNGESCFTVETFELLEGLHEDPTRDYYTRHRDKFKKELMEPFRGLFREIAKRMPELVSETMEMEKRILSIIFKNDFGRGEAWDFYWGAFYPKGGRRIEGPQLFTVINYERLEYGFSIGDYGKELKQRFLKNCSQNKEELIKLLAISLDDEEFRFGEATVVGDDENATESNGLGLGRGELDWKSWLRNPAEAGIGVRGVISKEEVLQTPFENLADRISHKFIKLFPLVLLGISETPLPLIREYIEPVEEDNPIYPLKECAEETCYSYEMLERWVRAIERKKQAIIYGPPGTSKTYLAEKIARHLIGGGDGFTELVQFHPAYAYEDFMQGIRPRSTESGGLEYPVVPGRFLKFCEAARSRTGRCVLIIDEINRANLARVFGELMYLLEYRGSEVPLAGGGVFKIPERVRIIGTMNTADRSIALVDHALRRRFAFFPLYPKYDVLKKYHEKNDTGFEVGGLIEILRELNEAIDDRHYHVGITYFLQESLEKHIEDIWQMEVEPYLEEYFFGQSGKVEQFSWERVKDKILR